MPKQALYLKWRPQLFDDVIGQEHITRTLLNALRSGRVRHAYLFSGPRGTGKTTTARLLAKALNCRHEDPMRRPCNACSACEAVNEGRYFDLIEIDAATHTGVDDVRDLRDKIAFSPGEGTYKVYIIDEVHRFTGNAFDALLKTLEEPPAHAVFVLATTEIDRVPATIKSRCLQFEFRRVSVSDVAERLAAICDAEGLRYEHAALELVARYGTGSVRDSISLLDQIVADPSEPITLDMAQRVLGAASVQAVAAFVDALVLADAAAALHVLSDAVDHGSDPRQFAQQVLEQLRALLLVQAAGPDLVTASAEQREALVVQAGRIDRGRLLQAVRAFNEAANDTLAGWQPQLALEVALLESVRGGSAAPTAAGQAPAVASGPSLSELTAHIERVVQAHLAGAGAATAKPGKPTRRAPTAPAPMPDMPAADAPPAVSMDAVVARWDETRMAVKAHNSAVAAMMEWAKPHAVRGDVVTLAATDIFAEKLSFKDHPEMIAHVLSTVHGVALRVRIIQGDEAPAPDNHTDPLAAHASSKGALVQVVDDDD